MLSSQTRADYFDVTLVGDDSKYNLAHKVVLATSSAKRVHPHPLVNFDIATFRFRNFLVSKLFHVFFMVSVSVSKKIGIEKSIGIGFENFWYRKKVSVLVSKKFGIEKSIGIGIGKILVSKKVSVLVSEKNWYRKKYRYRYRKKLVSEKSFGFGFVQILGFVTHWWKRGGCGAARRSQSDQHQRRRNTQVCQVQASETGERAKGVDRETEFWLRSCGGGGGCKKAK